MARNRRHRLRERLRRLLFGARVGFRLPPGILAAMAVVLTCAATVLRGLAAPAR